jgi:hypothetical protein
MTPKGGAVSVGNGRETKLLSHSIVVCGLARMYEIGRSPGAARAEKQGVVHVIEQRHLSVLDKVDRRGITGEEQQHQQHQAIRPPRRGAQIDDVAALALAAQSRRQTKQTERRLWRGSAGRR